MKICVIVLFCTLFFASCFITKTKKTLPLTDAFAKDETLYDYENELFDTDQLNYILKKLSSF